MWAERTPEGFRFDVKAYSLLTGHPAKPQSLWSDLRDGLPDDVRQKRNIYASHLQPAQLDEVWRRLLMMRYGRCTRPAGWERSCFSIPRCFTPKPGESRAEIEALWVTCPSYMGVRRTAFAEMVRADP